VKYKHAGYLVQAIVKGMCYLTAEGCTCAIDEAFVYTNPNRLRRKLRLNVCVERLSHARAQSLRIKENCSCYGICYV
jgi:hypothetical protein